MFSRSSAEMASVRPVQLFKSVKHWTAPTSNTRKAIAYFRSKIKSESTKGIPMAICFAFLLRMKQHLSIAAPDLLEFMDILIINQQMSAVNTPALLASYSGILSSATSGPTRTHDLKIFEHRDRANRLFNTKMASMGMLSANTKTMLFPGPFPKFFTDIWWMERYKLHGQPPSSIKQVVVWGSRKMNGTTFCSLVKCSDELHGLLVRESFRDALHSPVSGSTTTGDVQWLGGLHYVYCAELEILRRRLYKVEQFILQLVSRVRKKASAP